MPRFRSSRGTDSVAQPSLQSRCRQPEASPVTSYYPPTGRLADAKRRPASHSGRPSRSDLKELVAPFRVGVPKSRTQTATYPIFSSKGPLSKATAADKPSRRQPLFMPHTCRSQSRRDRLSWGDCRRPAEVEEHLVGESCIWPPRAATSANRARCANATIIARHIPQHFAVYVFVPIGLT